MGSVGGWVFVLDFTWSVGNFISSAVGRGGGEILLGWAHINVRSGEEGGEAKGEILLG